MDNVNGEKNIDFKDREEYIKMGLLDLLKKTPEKDMRELEIYSGMRVIVKALDGKMLFIAKLQDPQGNTAQLCQYSAAENFQNMEITPISVKLRGYSDWERKAVFMEGNMFPLHEHTWQMEDLVITKIENERAFPRFNTDIAAVVTAVNGTDVGEQACKILNISVGGVCIESEHRYQKGDRFLLRARLVEDRPLSVMYCEVLRVVEIGKDVSRFEYGCRFLELTEADQEELSQTIILIAKTQQDTRDNGSL